MMNINCFPLSKIFLAIPVIFTLLTGGIVPEASALDYEGAITAKMSEIKWKQADLLTAQRQLAIIDEFLGNYDTKTADLNSARQQLENANTTLATINQQNLVKATIRLAIETGTKTADAINLGKTAANGFITYGLRSAVGGAAFEKATGDMTTNGQAALGADAATLSSPRNVKIKAVSDAARTSFPSLDKVQQVLKMDGNAVAARCLHDTGTVIDPLGSGVIFYKNVYLRETITEALDTLDTLSTVTGTAKTDADTNLPLSLADVTQLETDIATLNTALESLKAQQLAEETAARLAANQAAVPPPVVQPIPPQDTGETYEEYQVRISAEALARWNDETPSLLASISANQSQIETAQSAIDTAVSTSITGPGIAEFISTYGGGDGLDAATTASYNDSISSYAAIEQWINDVTPGESALPGIITQVEALTDLYNTLFNLQNQISSLKTLLEESYYSAPPPNYDTSGWNIIPGMGQNPAEELAVVLNQHLNQLPTALANANSLEGKLAAATDAWSSASSGINGISPINSVGADLDESLIAAETALAAMITQATAWENLLAAAPGLVLDSLTPIINLYQNPPIGRLGFFAANPNFYTLVLGHAFDMETYKSSLLAALSTPGSTGLNAARGLRAKYDALVTVAPTIKDGYDAAWQSYQTALAHVQAYAGEGMPHFPVYDNWLQATAYTSEAHPVDTSTVTDQAARYYALYNTSNVLRYTTLTGGTLIGGESQDQILQWSGLPNMRQLPDPGLDDPINYLPHRIAAMKAVIVEDGPTWISLSEDNFNTHFNETMAELWIMDGEAAQADDGSQAVVTALREELAPLQAAYYAAHPAPTITVQPASSVTPIPAGSTAQLFVTATSDLLTYQWSMSTNSGGFYEDIVGATASTLITPALSATRWFRVVIRNPGGTVTSNPACIEVSTSSTTIVFTSAASASAQVGVPFSWTFTTSPSGMISVDPATILPSGLTFANGTLAGTPTTDGIWNVLVKATLNQQSQPIQQTFRLTIKPQVPNADSDGDGMDDAWEILHFGNLVTANTMSDFDKDGYTDLQEFLNEQNNLTDPEGIPYNPNQPNVPNGTGYYNPSKTFWILMTPVLMSRNGHQ